MDLKNKIVLVTAGATHEAIDPVRFIGNRSTGKMGISIAQALLERGAIVQLVLGIHQVSIETQENLMIFYTATALDMYKKWS